MMFTCHARCFVESDFKPKCFLFNKRSNKMYLHVFRNIIYYEKIYKPCCFHNKFFLNKKDSWLFWCYFNLHLILKKENKQIQQFYKLSNIVKI